MSKTHRVHKNSTESIHNKRNSSAHKKLESKSITHKLTKNIKLVEDYFGFYVDDFGQQFDIKRFTWTNHNCIRVQVITFGARVTSIQLPNRKRIIDDIVLGFDNIAGYIHYDKVPMGATIGRVSDKIERATFVLNDKQYWLNVNDGIHHSNGGFNGLDRKIWTPYVHGAKLMLSYVSRDLEEGYPGDVLFRIAFELTSKNEFTIEMDATATKPTIVNLSNLLYFNLGGHGSGAEEIDKHIVSINSNCFLPMKNKFPTGEILNVIYTKNDFQMPKILSNEMGNEIDNGFDTHYCINRGIDQGMCFVARALHPPSGRILEMYSNQFGVHFSTANDLERGLMDLPVSESAMSRDRIESVEKIFKLINKLHEHVLETIGMDSNANYESLRHIIPNLQQRRFSPGNLVTTQGSSAEEHEPKLHQSHEELVLNPLQAKYLEGMIDVITKRDSVTSYAELETIVRKVLDTAIIQDELEMNKAAFLIDGKTTSSEGLDLPMLGSKGSDVKTWSIKLENKIPSFYKDGRMHGKNDAIYKRQGAMCFQSENYPNAIYHRNFPNCILRPGETYKHNIVYKFWIQSGDPNTWLKRNFPVKKS